MSICIREIEGGHCGTEAQSWGWREPGALEAGKGGPRRPEMDIEKEMEVARDKLLLCFHFIACRGNS